MKTVHFLLNCIFVLSLGSLMLSCSENDKMEDSSLLPQTYNVSGKVEKGPFANGSTITMQLMDAAMQTTGETFTSTIQDNAGNYTFGSKSFNTPYVALTSNGYFFNEVNGTQSAGTLNLKGIVDLSANSTVNVNILTHLEYQRILDLVSKGNTFKEANRQAHNELLTTFSLQKCSKMDATQISIMDGTDESAALIAISSLLLADRNEVELTEYLSKLSLEFAQNGAFSDETIKQIRDDRMKLSNSLSMIKENIIRHYKGLGISVDVKDIGMFLDWDDDGIAGNETLKEGETISLEMDQLDIPNAGGTYTIKITSPIPVYLTPIMGGILDEEDNSLKGLYIDGVQSDISMEKTIKNNVLTIKVARLNSRFAKSAKINIYDCLGNILASVTLTQDGDKNLALPTLGDMGKASVSSAASLFAKGLSCYNLIEQYYHFNTQSDIVARNITPYNNCIRESWNSLYSTVNRFLMLKEADAQQLNVYQDIINVFNAMCYYHMVVGWGGVPYITEHSSNPGNQQNVTRTTENEILDNLKYDLLSAIETLEEKKNNSLQDTNSFFFLSKDVVRILLANIYMYQKDYLNAEKLLAKVIDNGFYTLNASNFSDMNVINDINGSNPELIFALDGRTRTRSNVVVQSPSIIPLFTYTEVLLSYAECLFKSGSLSTAKAYLDEVVFAKGITVSDDIFDGIKEARCQLLLYSVGNFAFMKRNDIAKDEYNLSDNHWLLFPIPQEQVDISRIEQNPGY